jgi:hypothetical protein
MTFRTASGDWPDVREIPCILLYDYMDDDALTPADEAAREAERERRGALYENHIGAGDAPRLPGWGGIPVFGCNHLNDPRLSG